MQKKIFCLPAMWAFQNIKYFVVKMHKFEIMNFSSKNFVAVEKLIIPWKWM